MLPPRSPAMALLKNAVVVLTGEDEEDLVLVTRSMSAPEKGVLVELPTLQTL